MRTRLLVAAVLAGAAGLLGLSAQSGPSAFQIAQTDYLKASNTDASDHFGCGGVIQGHTGQGVAISADGTTMAVGAPHEGSGAAGVNGNQRDNSVFDAGAVYVFTRGGKGWTQQAYVKASNPRGSAEFGHSVALSADGNTLAVSAYWESSNANGINGNQKDESIPQAGAVYVFTRRGTAWTQQAYIKASNTGEAGTADSFGEGDQFAFSLALSGDGNTLAVGALTEDSGSGGINGNQADNSAASAGAVYVFARAGTTWSQQAYVKSSNIRRRRPVRLFGGADGRRQHAGRGRLRRGRHRRAVSTARPTTGPTARVRPTCSRAPATAWSQQAYIKASNGESQDSFGVHVALNDDGTTLLVGSLDEDCTATGPTAATACGSDMKEDLSMGAAYVFVRAGTAWSQQAFLKASNTSPNDWFGSRVALSGDGNLAVVGASLEDGAAKGINGRQDVKTAGEAGALYVFRRSGTAWTQAAYVKGANTEAFDEFGSSIAMDRAGSDSRGLGARRGRWRPWRRAAVRPTTPWTKPARCTCFRVTR